MTQVSRYPVSKKVEERMFEIFRKTISSLKESSDIESFLEEFISPVEKIMLAKRLSIAVLLTKGLDYEAIKQILHVTPTTIAKVNRQRMYAGVGYRKVVEKILADESVLAFWEKIEDVLANIPNSKGSDIYKKKREHERQKFLNRKAF